MSVLPLDSGQDCAYQRHPALFTVQQVEGLVMRMAEADPLKSVWRECDPHPSTSYDLFPGEILHGIETKHRFIRLICC